MYSVRTEGVTTFLCVSLSLSTALPLTFVFPRCLRPWKGAVLRIYVSVFLAQGCQGMLGLRCCACWYQWGDRRGEHSKKIGTRQEEDRDQTKFDTMLYFSYTWLRARGYMIVCVSVPLMTTVTEVATPIMACWQRDHLVSRNGGIASKDSFHRRRIWAEQDRLVR